MARQVTSAMLSHENCDRTVGRSCPTCGFLLSPDKSAWTDWPPIAVIEAPFIGGFAAFRPYAIVKECPKCFALCWSHGDEKTKTFAEEIIAGEYDEQIAEANNNR